jgi:uncharacterized protein
MRLTQDSTSGINLIRGYAAGEIRINEQAYAEALLVSAQELQVLGELPAVGKLTVGDFAPGVRTVDDRASALAQRVIGMQAEIVLLGTGPRQVFPDASFGAHFLRKGIGFEVMDSGAACRTFNVLVAEQRRVVAILLP